MWWKYGRCSTVIVVTHLSRLLGHYSLNFGNGHGPSVLVRRHKSPTDKRQGVFSPKNKTKTTAKQQHWPWHLVRRIPALPARTVTAAVVVVAEWIPPQEQEEEEEVLLRMRIMLLQYPLNRPPLRAHRQQQQQQQPQALAAALLSSSKRLPFAVDPLEASSRRVVRIHEVLVWTLENWPVSPCWVILIITVCSNVSHAVFVCVYLYL